MSDTGRLIINARGESAKAIPHDGKVMLQASARYDRTTGLIEHDLMTVEVDFTKREIKGLILQLADAAGLACEVSDVPARRTRCYGDAAIDACDTRDICARWGCRKQPMKAETRRLAPGEAEAQSEAEYTVPRIVK